MSDDAEPQEDIDNQNDPDYEEEPDPKREYRQIPEEEIKCALLYYRQPKKGSRSIDSMNKKFRWIKKRSDIDSNLLR